MKIIKIKGANFVPIDKAAEFCLNCPHFSDSKQQCLNDLSNQYFQSKAIETGLFVMKDDCYKKYLSRINEQKNVSDY